MTFAIQDDGSEPTIERVEISLENAKAYVAVKDRALKLAENKDFKAIILDGYIKDEAARLTGLLGDPQIKEQDEVLNDLRAIASFQRYLRAIVRKGEMMEKEVEDHMQALDEMRAESHD